MWIRLSCMIITVLVEVDLSSVEIISMPFRGRFVDVEHINTLGCNYLQLQVE